jgi:hypothetical protein
MNDYGKKVHSREPDPYENISVNPIEKDKKGKEDYPNQFREHASKSQIFATLVSFFKKIVSLFGFKEKGDLLVFGHELYEHLFAFRSLLLALADQDESHRPEFIQQLSELWNQLIDDCNAVSSAFDSSSDTMNHIKFLIAQIAQYPQGADHTLGYYFEAFAGKDWIPFPYMDLLQELHEEYQNDIAASHLAKWIFLLDDILSIPRSEG